MDYNISFFERKTDNRPKIKRIIWADLIRRERAPHLRPIKDGTLISGTTFADDIDLRRPRRLKALANESSMIFGDVDHGATFDQVAGPLARLSIQSLLYTTYSHQIESESNPKAE